MLANIAAPGTILPVLSATLSERRTEMQLISEACEAFRFGHLMCYKRLLPGPDGGPPLVCWVAGNQLGVVNLNAAPQDPRLAAIMPNGHCFGDVLIGDTWWMGWDLGRHTPRPVVEWDQDQGPFTDGCHFLDGVPCYYDGSSLQAQELLRRTAEAGNEEHIWYELQLYFAAWIVRQADYEEAEG